MKKILTVILLLTVLTSCDNREELKAEIERLESQKQSLFHETARLQAEKLMTSIEVYKLQEELKALGMYRSGKTPRYILKVRLKQSRFSLSISDHIKDQMNAIEFELPVDKEFYDSVSEGTEIVDRFRVGSLLLNGSFGEWNMSVIGKEIR